MRIVRRSSVPGDRLKARGVLGSVILLGVASLVVFPILYEVVAWQGRQAEQDRDLAVMVVTQDVSGAMMTVSRFGSALSEGAGEQELAFMLAPDALKSAGALLERSRKGEVGGLVLLQVEEPRYESTKDLLDSSATLVVHAMEQNHAGRTLRLTVQKKVRNFSEGGFDMTYRIVRIEPAGP